MDPSLSPARRAAGRLGGLAFAARHDTAALSRSGRDAYRASFADGHGCAMCAPIQIPTHLAPAERARRAEALWKLHFARLGAKRRG